MRWGQLNHIMTQCVARQPLQDLGAVRVSILWSECKKGHTIAARLRTIVHAGFDLVWVPRRPAGLDEALSLDQPTPWRPCLARRKVIFLVLVMAYECDDGSTPRTVTAWHVASTTL